jgi:3-carboxy-cis,cis-muconate cycloisomerase
VRPSSSTSDLFAGTAARGGVAAAVSGEAWLRAMLDVEVALARACGRLGHLDAEVVAAVEAACDPSTWDLATLAAEGAEHASPVVPLACELRRRAGEHAHAGATSQDVLDTAMMLVARRALEVLAADAGAAADAAAALADAHRETVLAARTLLQQALPTSFGLKAAGWLMGIEEALAGLLAVRDCALAVQMGGPVGHRDPAVASEVATDLGLVQPVLPWPGDRTRPAALACSLGVLAGALAKPARDVALLAQTEVAEVREGGNDRGGSSAMAHKRNPVAAVSVLACTSGAPGLVATVLAGMAGEHERAAGAWQAEWPTLTALLRLTGSAAAWARDLLEHLEVDPAAMRANVRVEGDLGASGALIDRALLAHRAATR